MAETIFPYHIIYSAIFNHWIYSPSGGCTLARSGRCRRAAVLGAVGDN